MTVLYQPGQSQRFNDAFARGASPFECSTTPDIRAQKESLRAPPCGCGAFRCDPVSRLYLARPFAVSPAPAFVDNFSPRPTANEGFLAMIYQQDLVILPPVLIFAVLADCLKASAVGAPLEPGLRICSLEPWAIRSRLALILAYKPPSFIESALTNSLPTF